jgi:hypothetical protein
LPWRIASGSRQPPRGRAPNAGGWERERGDTCQMTRNSQLVCEWLIKPVITRPVEWGFGPANRITTVTPWLIRERKLLSRPNGGILKGQPGGVSSLRGYAFDRHKNRRSQEQSRFGETDQILWAIAHQSSHWRNTGRADGGEPRQIRKEAAVSRAGCVVAAANPSPPG